MEHTIRTSWITLHRFIFQELISVIITPPITPNNFWRFSKRNSLEILPLLVLSLLGRSPPLITPKYSQRINWRNKLHLCYTRKFSGNQLHNPNGPNGTRKRCTYPLATYPLRHAQSFSTWLCVSDTEMDLVNFGGGGWGPNMAIEAWLPNYG